MKIYNLGAIIEDTIRTELLQESFQKMGKVDKLIDVGCGTRPYMNLYAPYCNQTIGADLADVPFAQHKVDIYCSATKIPLPDSSMDAVFSSEVLHDIQEPHEMFREANRILKPGGRLIITSPFVTPICDDKYDHYRYTKFGLKYLMEKNGFTEIQIRETGEITAAAIQLFIKPQLRFWNIVAKKSHIKLFSSIINPFIFFFIFLPQYFYLMLYKLSKHIKILGKIFTKFNYGAIGYVSYAVKS